MSPTFSSDTKETRKTLSYPSTVSFVVSSALIPPVLVCNQRRKIRLEFKRNLGNEQPLNGLLQVYKDYYPDVIVGDVAPTRLGLFSVSHVAQPISVTHITNNNQHPSPEWLQKRLSIQESNTLDYSGSSEASSFKIVRKIGGQGTKRRKTSHLLLPEVHTFHATEVSAQSA